MPQYESMEIRDGKARIRFKYGSGLTDGTSADSICGADKIYPAECRRKPVRSGRFVEQRRNRGRALLFPRFQPGNWPIPANCRSFFPYGRFLSLLTVGIAGPGLRVEIHPAALPCAG